MKKIRILAIADKKIFSIASFILKNTGDVLFYPKLKGLDTQHFSRHASGVTHYKISNNSYQKIRKSGNIKDFSGIELLCTNWIDLNELSQFNDDFNFRRSDGLFILDSRNFPNQDIQIMPVVLTEEGEEKLLSTYRNHRNRQIYLYTDCQPSLGLLVFSRERRKTGD